MGDGAVSRAPCVISCMGLGSCVAVVLYDTRRKIGGLAHVMLPDSNNVNRRPTPYQCVDTAIAALLDEMRKKGAILRDIAAKLAGGARMFASDKGSSTGIGEQNIVSVKHTLKREEIPVVGDDVGGHHGRSLEFCLDSGKVIVKAWGKEDREL